MTPLSIRRPTLGWVPRASHHSERVVVGIRIPEIQSNVRSPANAARDNGTSHVMPCAFRPDRRPLSHLRMPFPAIGQPWIAPHHHRFHPAPSRVDRTNWQVVARAELWRWTCSPGFTPTVTDPIRAPYFNTCRSDLQTAPAPLCARRRSSSIDTFESTSFDQDISPTPIEAQHTKTVSSGCRRMSRASGVMRYPMATRVHRASRDLFS